MLKQKFREVTFATHDRLVNLFKQNLDGITVISEDNVDHSNYDEVIELGNYPKFNNDLEKVPQITYFTHKKVKQHAIEHYKDGIVSRFNDIEKQSGKFPYFKRSISNEQYYTIHPGAGFCKCSFPHCRNFLLMLDHLGIQPTLLQKEFHPHQRTRGN